MKIVLLDEAQRRFEAEDRWWREHRDAKDLFVAEFEQVLQLIASTPAIGQHYRRARGKQIQRVLMKKTGCHVYYFCDTERASSRFIRSGVLVEGADRRSSNKPRRDEGRGFV